MIDYNPHIPTHAYLVADAVLHGVEAAALLYHIKYILQRNQNSEQNIFDDIHWYRIEKNELLRQFPYFKNRQKIERLLVGLVKKDVLICKNHNENQSDQTKWYALQTAQNLNALNRALQCPDVSIVSGEKTTEQNQKINDVAAENLNAQNRALQCPEVSDAMPTSGHCHIYNIDSIKETLESAPMRDLDVFGFLEFIERFNQIPKTSNFVYTADKILFTGNDTKANKIHFLINKYNQVEIETAFKTIENNNFLLGLVKFKDGGCFKLGLDWLTKPENFKNVLNGKYKKSEKPANFKPKPSQYETPEEWQAAWNKILAVNSKMKLRMFKRMAKFMANDPEVIYITSRGQKTKLKMMLWNFLFPGNAQFTDSHIHFQLFTHTRFPDCYKRPVPKAKLGGDI